MEGEAASGQPISVFAATCNVIDMWFESSMMAT